MEDSVGSFGKLELDYLEIDADHEMGGSKQKCVLTIDDRREMQRCRDAEIAEIQNSIYLTVVIIEAIAAVIYR